MKHQQWLSWCRFYLLRAAKAQPWLLAFAALLVAALAVAGALYVEQVHRVASLERDNKALTQRLLQPVAAATQQGGAAPDLPVFEPVKLVEAINRLAQEAKLPLDEVAYVLEDNPTQRYMRYRATLTVSVRYPAIRRFIETLQAEQPQVSLDTVSCVREDITTVAPTCDLSLSAFYRKRVHG